MSYAPQSSPPRWLLPACLGVLLGLGTVQSEDGHAQARVRLRAATPIHAEPGGNQLGTLPAGLNVAPGRTSGTWREVPIEGWVWTASTGPSARPGFDIAVTADGGENVRVEPDGAVLFRAVRGTHFNRVTRRGGWTQVRRTVWLPAQSVAAAVAAARPSPPVERPPADRPTAIPDPAAPAAAAPVAATLPASDTLPRVTIRRGARLAAGPGADAIGAIERDTPGQVTGRAGDWVRIRTEAWVRREDTGPARDSAAVTLDQLRADPERYRGQPVSWPLQFLALKVADELRPELPAGEPYVLARGPLPEAGFVYVAVTLEQAARFRAMRPLDEFTANGTILAARTRYLPTPVIDLRRAP